MATKSKLGKVWVYLPSSSILNFHKKLASRYNLKHWEPADLYSPCLFIGMYHIGDYLRLMVHRGERKIFWCGSDLRDMNPLKRFIIRHIKARHVCETAGGEYEMLKRMGITAEVLPQVFFNPDEFKPCFRASKKPQVFMNCHEGRRIEYGVGVIESFVARRKEIQHITFHVYGIERPKGYEVISNVVYHGPVSEEQFNKEIKKYHAGLRFNHFDGNSEIVMKSVLLGQYPITYLKYPHIDQMKCINDLITHLRGLSRRTGDNPAHIQWRKLLEANKARLLS